MTNQRLASRLALCFCALLAALFSLYELGYRVNLTNSLPGLIYKIEKITDKTTLERGDVVVLDYSLIDSPVITMGIERGYLSSLSNFPTRAPMMKRIGAMSGDTVLLRHNHLYLNGKDCGDMVILSEDSQGRPLCEYPTPVTLRSGEYWLISNPFGGFDSRYFGAVTRKSLTHKSK